MKYKILIFTLIFLFTQEMHSQNDDLKYEFVLNMNFKMSTEDVSIGSYSTDMQSKNAKLEIGINRYISSRLMLGIGLDYFRNKKQFDYSYYNIENDFLVENYPQLESNIYIPFINLKYVKALSDKFVISMNICNGIGFSTSKQNSLTSLKVNLASSEFISEDPGLTGSLKSYENENDKSFYSLSLEPEISYYFSNSIGLKLKGDLYRFDKQNKSQFFFNTKSNQIAWTLGLSWRI